MADLDIATLDAQYAPFPSFAEWVKATFDAVDAEGWVEALSALTARKEAAGEVDSQAAMLAAMRAAGASTGAIEGLYEAERGLTITVMTQAATWQASVEKTQGIDIRRLIDAQIKGYEMAFDLSTGRQPISEALVRRLHEVICEPQATYKAHTAIGIQEQPLPKGAYKENPNHVELLDGSTHAYAPVLATASEMHRLIEELSTKQFADAHPCLQSSYTHYALVVVHPFADGNGRVARALASVYLLRAASVPLILFADQKGPYFDSLARADQGDAQPFVNYMTARAIESVLLVADTLRADAMGSPNAGVRAIKSLYTTATGLTHEQLDRAAANLFDATLAALTDQIGRSEIGDEIDASVQKQAYGYASYGPLVRVPVVPPQRCIVVRLATKAPAMAEFVTNLMPFVSHKHIVRPVAEMRLEPAGDTLSVSVEDLFPKVTMAASLRIDAWVQALLGIQLQVLAGRAAENLRSRGY